MASITRTKSETVATVTSSARKINVSVPQNLTIEESKKLRKLLKAEEVKAANQYSSPAGWASGSVFGYPLRDSHFSFTRGI